MNNEKEDAVVLVPLGIFHFSFNNDNYDNNK
jgi:hypothetical protein